MSVASSPLRLSVEPVTFDDDVAGDVLRALLADSDTGAHHVDSDGNLYLITRIPAAEAAVLKPLVAARAGLGNNPFVAHYEATGIADVMLDWSVS